MSRTTGHSGVLERRLQMAPVGDHTARGIMNLFVASAHAMDAFERVTGQAALSYASFNVLRILRGHPEGHPRSVIAQRLVTKNADVTRLIDGLVDRGLVRRARSKSDGRLSLARITPKGTAVLAKLDPLLTTFVEEYRGRLSEAEWIELSRLLEAVYERDTG
jgi:DNA-binding MarR family transcriptional regulator